MENFHADEIQLHCSQYENYRVMKCSNSTIHLYIINFLANNNMRLWVHDFTTCKLQCLLTVTLNTRWWVAHWHCY